MHNKNVTRFNEVPPWALNVKLREKSRFAFCIHAILRNDTHVALCTFILNVKG